MSSSTILHKFIPKISHNKADIPFTGRNILQVELMSPMDIESRIS